MEFNFPQGKGLNILKSRQRGGKGTRNRGGRVGRGGGEKRKLA